MKEKRAKQTNRVLDYINRFGSITQLEALRDIGVMSLSSRICDLKKSGYSIQAKTEVIINRYGEKCRIKRYSLEVYQGNLA